MTSVFLWAQGNSYQPQLLTFIGAPVNTCDVYQVALDTVSGNAYFCKNHVWTPATGGAVIAPGYTATANGNFGFDTTLGNWHFFDGAADSLNVATNVGTPTQGQIGYWDTTNGKDKLLSVSVIGDTIANGASVVVGQFSNPQPNDVGCFNGASLFRNCTLGVPVVTVSTTPVAIASNQRGNEFRLESGAVGLTIAQAGTAGFNNNFDVWIWNHAAAGAVTVTPTTSTITGGSTNVSGAAVANVNPGDLCLLTSDNTNYFLGCSIRPISINFTTAGATTSDVLTVTGMTASGHCLLSPSNTTALVASAWLDTPATNAVTLHHSNTNGQIFTVTCTPY